MTTQHDHDGPRRAYAILAAVQRAAEMDIDVYAATFLSPDYVGVQVAGATSDALRALSKLPGASCAPIPMLDGDPHYGVTIGGACYWTGRKPDWWDTAVPAAGLAP